jgi:transposase
MRGWRCSMGRYRHYSEEYKREALRLLEESGRRVSEVARDLGISEDVLRYWRKTLGSSGQGPAVESSPAGSLEEEVKRLKRENERLRQDKEILKKVLAIVSESPR